jgi:hypothetical protein
VNKRCWPRPRPKPPPQQQSPLRVTQRRPHAPIWQKTPTLPCAVLCVRQKRPPAPLQQSASKLLAAPRPPPLPRPPLAAKNARSPRRTPPHRDRQHATQTPRCVAAQQLAFSNHRRTRALRTRIQSLPLRKHLYLLSHRLQPERQRTNRTFLQTNRARAAIASVAHTALIRPPLCRWNVTPPGPTTSRRAARRAIVPTMHPESDRFTAAPTSMPVKPSTLVRHDIQFQWRAAPFLCLQQSNTRSPHYVRLPTLTKARLRLWVNVAPIPNCTRLVRHRPSLSPRRPPSPAANGLRPPEIARSSALLRMTPTLRSMSIDQWRSLHRRDRCRLHE